jgi:hypothetical protein
LQQSRGGRGGETLIQRAPDEEGIPDGIEMEKTERARYFSTPLCLLF